MNGHLSHALLTSETKQTPWLTKGKQNAKCNDWRYLCTFPSIQSKVLSKIKCSHKTIYYIILSTEIFLWMWAWQIFESHCLYQWGPQNIHLMTKCKPPILSFLKIHLELYKKKHVDKLTTTAAVTNLLSVKTPFCVHCIINDKVPGPSGLPGRAEAESASPLPSSIMKRSSTVPPSLRPITTLTSPLCFNRQCLCVEKILFNTFNKLAVSEIIQI